MRHFLAARSLIGVTGPLGWEHAVQATGRLQLTLPPLADGVLGDLRAVQPLVSIGYRSRSDAAIELYLEESMTFVVRDDRAAVGLVYPS